MICTVYVQCCTALMLLYKLTYIKTRFVRLHGDKGLARFETGAVAPNARDGAGVDAYRLSRAKMLIRPNNRKSDVRGVQHISHANVLRQRTHGRRGGG